MQLETLRTRHPRFVYQSFTVERANALQQPRSPEPGSDAILVRYHFLLEPDIEFHPEVVIPIDNSIPVAALEPLLFHLGLIEMISYWKCACSPEIIIRAGWLADAEIQWWHDLLIHGLGEFFCRNDIDFSSPHFFSIRCEHDESRALPLPSTHLDGDLILVGGGKDSSLTLELLKSQGGRMQVLALNPTRASLDSARIAGYTNPIVVRRTLDPTLLECNAKGYLNGHTPFSAYLAFLSTITAVANGFRRVITSNEASADQANLHISGVPINHQYSKSLRFERLFRQYSRAHLSAEIEFYSFLRPLHDIQISMLFSGHRRQLRSFRSCNVNQKSDSWCGHCPKCAFVFLTLAPFLPKKSMLEVFGSNYFEDTAVQDCIRDLVGDGSGKPFECVGTMEESVLALQLAIAHERTDGVAVPENLRALPALNKDEMQQNSSSLLSDWSEQHFLPLYQEELLQNALRERINEFARD